MDSELLYKLNVSHLKNSSYVGALVGLWNSFPKPNEGESYRLWWHKAISKCFEFLRAFGKIIAWK